MFSSCIDNLERAIEENRKLSHELVTPDLTEQSLKEQLNSLFQSMLGDNGLDVTIDVSGFDEHLIDNTKKLSLYRIAQEQCTNIIKHAHATKVDVNLAITDGIITMTITDNGVGKDVINNLSGIGLKNMEGRVRIFDGGIRIVSAPYKGFTLEVYLPAGHEMQVE
jgi:signal transduction histidine kinase